MADTTYQPKVYRKQGGESFVVADGGDIDIEAGGSLKFAGVAISPAIEIVEETNVITAAENGTTFFLKAAAGFASTLPAPAAGLRFTFIVHTAPTSNGYTIVTNGTTQKVLKGLVVVSGDGSGADVSAGGTTATFVHNKALPGDRVDMICDGTIWYMVGYAQVAAGLTITGE